MLFRHQSPSLLIHTPAKLNVYLQVLGKRLDGFHELETVMVSVGLYDTLRFTDDPSGDCTLRCVDRRRRGPSRTNRDFILPADGSNLVLRAANRLREATGTTRGVRIELYKRIPLAAGLAGGSSDAAATLAGLNRLWKLRLSTAALRELAAELGSDVPFFLHDTAVAVCRGRGEIIEPVKLSTNLHFVIARPSTGLSTPLVFRHCRPGVGPWPVAAMVECLAQGRIGRVGSRLYNSLQEPAERLNPEVAQLRDAFSRQPFAGHLMSGSGTSYFGLCAHRRQALQLSARLRASRLGDVFVAQSRPW
jgi:4-diphosphocytidyl-2-C-methyl-D-erythritol kinase